MKLVHPGEEEEIAEDDNEIKVTNKSKLKPKRYVVKVIIAPLL